MADDRLIYLPLGGAGEIGMNMYLYGYGPKGKERFIIADVGVTFPNMDTSPGVDLIMPDISWIARRANQIEAIFITHAHEDHVGAIGLLWDRLGAPVYARRFTAAIARLKMEERGLKTETVKTVGTWPEQIKAGPFRVGFLPVSHSIPEASALVIDTPAGRILHTADFKLDGNPGVGEPFDPKLWHDVARGGIRALVCDSTNVFAPHPGRSEATLIAPIRDLVQGHDGMVVATTFASNVARVRTLAEAGREAGRSIVLLGRAMRRMVQVAMETGVLKDFPPTIGHEEALAVPRENLMLLVTGSQGERRAASAQLSQGKYLGLEMKAGDLFLFSSKTIPGNEVHVGRIANNFSEMGVDVVDDSSGAYHVSGHANRPDLEAVHELMKPEILLPMHGEHRHLREHAKLGTARGIASLVAVNGTMVDLTTARPEIVEHVETGRTYLDGTRLLGAMDGVVRDRIRMALNGHVVVGVVIDEEGGLLGDAWVETMGLAKAGRSNAPLAERIEAAIGRDLSNVSPKVLDDDEKLESALRRTVRHVALEEIGKKPEVTVLISRLLDE